MCGKYAGMANVQVKNPGFHHSICFYLTLAHLPLADLQTCTYWGELLETHIEPIFIIAKTNRTPP